MVRRGIPGPAVHLRLGSDPVAGLREEGVVHCEKANEDMAPPRGVPQLRHCIAGGSPSTGLLLPPCPWRTTSPNAWGAIAYAHAPRFLNNSNLWVFGMPMANATSDGLKNTMLGNGLALVCVYSKGWASRARVAPDCPPFLPIQNEKISTKDTVKVVQYNIVVQETRPPPSFMTLYQVIHTYIHTCIYIYIYIGYRIQG